MLEEIRYCVIKGVDKSGETRIFRIVNIFGWTYLIPFKVRKKIYEVFCNCHTKSSISSISWSDRYKRGVNSNSQSNSNSQAY